MLLQDYVYIDAPPEKVFRFFEHMDEHYTDRHPDHICFEWREGRGLQEGNTFYFEEHIAGEVLKKETRFTEIRQSRYIEFTMVNWFYRLFIPKMTFITEPQGEGCMFTGQVLLRGIGPLGRWSHRKQFAAVRQHMKEEGENMKRIIEQDKSERHDFGML